MPRAPKISEAIQKVGASVFSPLSARVEELQRAGSELFPLHVGDTWLEPPDGCRMYDLPAGDHPGLHRYLADTRGLPALIDALLERARTLHGLPYERSGILVTAGATLGLSNALSAILDPDEEVLLLAPYWPLIRGIVHSLRGRPVDVPFYDRVASARDAIEAVEAKLTSRTAALYVSTPSNPTGRVLPEAWLQALAEWARARDLWIVSDETYDRLVYRGEHVSIARFAPERTLTSFSFSKTYGLSGCRVGYLVGPSEQIAAAHRAAVHSGYSAPTPSQLLALRALERADVWLEQARAAYAETGRTAAQALGLGEPEGSTFLFIDVSARLDARGLLGFLHDCLDDGVQLAPGSACGDAYGSWVRLCYTAAPPERVAEAVARLARRL